MRLLRLYRISEAGVHNSPTNEPRKKKKSPFKHANGGATSHLDDVGDDDEEELGPDMDYEDPADEPTEPEQDVRPAKPFKEPEKPVPFARQSAKPSPALQGGKTSGRLSADPVTLSALERALENVRTGDDDLQSWIDDLLSEIGRAIRSGGEVTLPKFVAAADDDVEDADPEDED